MNASIKGKVKAAGLGGLLLATLALGVCGKHLSRDVYQARVVDKQVKRYDKKDTYVVMTKLEDGTPRVFRNTDSPLELKWNSSDVQAELEIGREYRISTYGFRIPLLSEYENIISVEEIKK